MRGFSRFKLTPKNVVSAIFWVALALTFAATVGVVRASEAKVILTGLEEIPFVATNASGYATITVNPDKSVNGTISTTGLIGAGALIHLGAYGKNGPPIITLIKTVGEEWSVPPGVILTDTQYALYLKGELYISALTPSHPRGEIRGQIQALNGG